MMIECNTIVAAHELGEKNLFDISMLDDENETANMFVRIKCIAGKLQVSVNETLDKTMAGLWKFMPEPRLAAVRGEDNKNNQIFVNEQSEYSSISLHENHLIIRLDDEYFSNWPMGSAVSIVLMVISCIVILGCNKFVDVKAHARKGR